ncbi:MULTISPECIES: class I SAM-dependent methyltransferase [unclassified Paenibacillus]|uniref:class I SAM-dependent methyltransferase n=1 Tax=unclassified Paenibacillus TaxID=185978 RepID=UPI001B660FF4|nr:MULTISPECIES: class I SAM-dependent methyltransferase [unclassified Paenibacillus]MBP1155583.1 ubiquinone/menaquinone biosynthesis C-methylase UbiE [Paenibacillus sp. PvP091]MBP1169031.1 ubiquinone/menaquinone biosynthesis C-methylase UbiE [Paenibacillus sp. PvR098]MBP2440059.1 ubiquinone/menaquinone biosynthesis C-methylase UbiE [Paenibacillus sp. PvP052]
MKPLEKKTFTQIRTEIISKAEGEVLEIGCGTGINFPFYKHVSVTAIEPNDVLRDLAHKRADQTDAPIHVVEGNAEKLPFKDHSFDTVVGTLVFCTIPDPKKAIREMMRVCKPKGKILIFEHTRHEHKMLAAMQDLLTPIWKRICDGCHLNRNTEQLLRQEGIEIVNKKTYMNKIFITVEGRNA